MHISACICMYKFVCVHVEVRGQPWVLFLGNLPICLLRQSLTGTWSLLIRLTGQETTGIFLPLLPQHWVYKHVYSIQLFPRLCSKNQSWVPFFIWQMVYHLNHFSRPHLTLKTCICCCCWVAVELYILGIIIHDQTYDFPEISIVFHVALDSMNCFPCTVEALKFNTVLFF